MLNVVTPTPSSLVERHFEVAGGKKALEQLEAVVRVGEITLFVDGQEFSGLYRTCVAYPDLGMIEIDAGPIKLLEGVSPKGAIVCDQPTRSCRPADARHAEELLVTVREANRELLYEQYKWSNGTVEHEEGSWIIRYDEAGNIPIVYSFSKDEKFLAAKRIGVRERHYRDWRPVDGVWFPFAIDDYENERLIVRIQLREVRQERDLACSWCAADLGIAPK